MPAMSLNAFTVNANTKQRDVFKDDTFHQATRFSRYRLYGRHATAVGTVEASIRHGRVTEGEDLGMVAAAGQPVIPDDLLSEAVLAPGETFKVDLAEVAGTNTPVNLRVMIDEA